MEQPLLTHSRHPELVSESVEARRPGPWVTLAALLAAPVGAAIVAQLVFFVGAVLAGYRPSGFSWDVLYSVVPFALVFLPLGGPLIALVWKRAPFGLLPCSMVGGAFGALVGYICVVGLSLPAENYPGVAAVIGMGVAGGIGGGLSVWLICRLGSRVRHD